MSEEIFDANIAESLKNFSLNPDLSIAIHLQSKILPCIAQYGITP